MLKTTLRDQDEDQTGRDQDRDQDQGGQDQDQDQQGQDQDQDLKKVVLIGLETKTINVLLPVAILSSAE